LTTTTGPRQHHADCALVRHIASVETPMVTELLAAMLHLERLAHNAGTPEQENQAYGNTSPEQYRSYVLENAARIRKALDEITTPYQAAETTPAGPA
jgi:hypothetical protein